MNPQLKRVLLEHKENQRRRYNSSVKLKRKRKRWSENGYMFLGRLYEPYVSENLSSALPKFCKAHNLPKISPYGLRYSFATFCSESGMNEIVLSKLMGHSSFETTKKYYIRVSSKRKKEEMAAAYTF